MTETERNKCLEVTASIVLEAMKEGGILHRSNGQYVAEYFLAVYRAVAEAVVLEPSLPDIPPSL